MESIWIITEAEVDVSIRSSVTFVWSEVAKKSTQVWMWKDSIYSFFIQLCWDHFNF